MTALRDALSLAVDKLVKIKQTYSNIIPRIIALTDGEDNHSSISSVEIAQKIITNKIILDSFVVGESCTDLKSITLASGGKCFYPKSLSDGIKLFEIETILTAKIRNVLYK